MRPRSAPASRLGAARLLLGTYTFAYLAKRRRMFNEINRTEPASFAPVGPCRSLDRPLPPAAADALSDATLVSTALFTLGVGHRVVGPAHAALLTWTLSYRNSWSKIYHNDNTLVLHNVLLGVSPATDAVSLPALGGRHIPPAHPRYGRPLWLMNAISAGTYLLAGIAKVAGPSRWEWATGEQLRRHVAIDAVRKAAYAKSPGPVAPVLYRHRRLFSAFAMGSLVLELAAPLALLHRRLGQAWAVGAFGMHWGIRAIMGIRFRYQQSGVSFAPWFEPERLLPGPLRRPRP